MNDRFLFNAVVSSYYDIDTPENYEEFEPQIYLENVDILSDEIGIDYDRLFDAVQKQLNLEKPEISQVMQHFKDNSNLNSEEYVTIKPDKILQCTGLKDKNGKLIYEGNIVNQIYEDKTIYKCVVIYNNCSFQLKHIEDKNKNYINTPMYCYATNYLGHYTEKRLEVIGNIYKNKELLEE